ncbi:MAG: DUF3794 domain-containing protein [Oscillospiraceae bacterium]|nr:DUF3794 domain-containing protein [Oscillospiraceae bacterium]
MQFDRISVPYLQKLTDQLRCQEQTLEVRLPDGMPDIGRVLGAWGQVIVRSKEWGSGTMSLTCGVMAWVLYMPEDEGCVQGVEAWLPFNVKWDLPETRYDGKILTSCLLKNVDARSTSARKLMVRANLETMGEAWQGAEAQVAVPTDVPEDVAVLTATYPVLLPKEAGEKTFLLEDQLNLPANCPKIEKIMYYSLHPEILEKKVMAGKVVFRGVGMVHILYRGEDCRLYTWDCELPFSQYGDLEGEYDGEPEVTIRPCVTSLDISLDENGDLQLKAGLLGQYLLWDRTTVTVAEDAYSPRREMTLTREDLFLPAVLDQTVHTVQAEKSVQADVQQIVDVTFCPRFGEQERTDTGISFALPGQMQMLYYDPNGALQGITAPWEGKWNMSVSDDCRVDTCITQAGKPQAIPGAGNVNLRAEVNVNAVTTAGQGISVITGAELGEAEKANPNRPSLILCRVGKRRLWDVAKQCGSTVEAIQRANSLQGEPDSNAVLLIPIA